MALAAAPPIEVDLPGRTRRVLQQLLMIQLGARPGRENDLARSIRGTGRLLPEARSSFRTWLDRFCHLAPRCSDLTDHFHTPWCAVDSLCAVLGAQLPRHRNAPTVAGWEGAMVTPR
jgi:hypothetical protein